MPCSTPIRLTSSTQRQVSSEISSMPPPPATPALLQTTWTLPKACDTPPWPRRSTLAGSATSQVTPRDVRAAIRRRLSTAAASASGLDIGEHHLHAGLREGPAERKPDAAGPAGHEGRLAGEITHDFLPSL